MSPLPPGQSHGHPVASHFQLSWRKKERWFLWILCPTPGPPDKFGTCLAVRVLNQTTLTLTLQMRDILSNHFAYRHLVWFTYWSNTGEYEERRFKTDWNLFVPRGQGQRVTKNNTNNNDNLGKTLWKLSRLARVKRKMVSLPFWAFNWSWQWDTHVETSCSQLELTGAQEKEGGWKYKSRFLSAQRDESWSFEPWHVLFGKLNK